MSVKEKLHDAFDEGDLATFKKLLSQNLKLLLRDDGKCSWYHNAAEDGRLDFVKYLIEEQQVDIDNPVGWYAPEGPIAAACGAGHIEMVKYLLDKGAKINHIKSPELQHRLAADGDPNYKPKVDFQPLTQSIPLEAAAEGDHFEIVKLLVENGAELHKTDEGITALDWADINENDEMAEYLKSKGMTE